MARNKEFLEDDFDFDIDMDLDFPGDKPLPPPKNKREAVTRALKDGFSGAKDELMQNPVKDIGKILDAGMPSSLRNEYGNVKEVIGDVKTATEEALGAIKKEGQGLAKNIAKLTPEGSKFRKLLDKLSGEQGETLRGPSKEQIQQDQINGAILGALGAQQEQSSIQEAIRNAMEEKRAATTANLLQSIYAEMRMERTFHYKITNSYYRKSLEIQMKQLYTQKELLELTRTNFANFKTQFEYMVLNTGLPDILKITKSEALSKDFAAKARKELIDGLYKNFNPYKAISKRMVGKIKGIQEGFVNGFQMMSGGLDMAGGMGNMSEMGMSSSNMAGMMFADWLKNITYGKLGEKLASTKTGKKFVYGAKNALMDPNAFINDMKNKKRTGKLGGIMDSFWNMMSDFTGSESKNTHKFEKKDLNAAQIFDGRAHQAIVKVIPGLLSKIYGELKAARAGGKPEDHEVVWDNKTDGFSTTKKMAANAIKDIKTNFAAYAGYYASSFTGMLTEYGGGQLSKTETNMINRALVAYLLNNKSSLAPNTIASSSFLNNIQDPKLRSKVGKMAKRVLKAARDNPRILDDIQYYMTSIRKAMPNPSGYMDDFHKSGNMQAAVKMGLAKRTNNGYVFDDKGLEQILLDTVLGEGEEQKEQLNKVEEFKQKIIEKGQRFKGAVVDGGMNIINKAISGTLSAVGAASGNAKKAYGKLKNMDKKSAINYFTKKKVKAEEIIDEKIIARMTPEQKAAVNKSINKISSVAKKVRQETDQLMKTAGDSAVAGQIRETQNRVDDKIGEFIEFANKNGYNKQAYDNFVKEIQAAANETKEKRETSGIASVADVAFKAATGASKEEWEQKTKEMYGKAAKGGMKFLNDLRKERPLEDLKQEFFNSEEGQKPNGPTFEEWMNKMGYKAKGSTLKKLRQATFALDRKMAKFLLALPFKVIKGGAKLLWKGKGLPFKGLKGAAKLGGSIVGGAGSQAGKLVKEIFTSAEKNGGQVGMTTAAQMTQATTALMTADSISKMADSVANKMNEDKGDKKSRKGSWLDRLNLFGKKEPKEKDMQKTMKESSGKGPIWMILGLLGGVFGFVKKMFGGIGRIGKLLFNLPGLLLGGIGKLFGLGASAITAAGSLIGKGVSKVKDMITGGDKDKTKTDLKDDKKPKGKNPPPEKPDKGSKKLMERLKSWLPESIYKKLESAVSKVKNMAGKFKTFFSRLGSIAKKQGGRIAKAIGKFLGKYVLSAATGLGIFVAIGFGIWDISWIMKYWIGDGLSLGNAICKQMIGFTPFGDGEDSEKDPFEEDAEGEGQEDSRNEHPTPVKNADGTYSSPLNSSTPINEAAARSNAYTGAAGKGSFETPKSVDGAKYNTSPYIKPAMQSSTGTPADIVGLKPEFRKRVEGFAKDYYQFTGKKLVVNSANRSLDDQVKMWEKEAKVKWTGNRAQDEKNVAAAGGKFYNFRGGTVAYPNPKPSIPGHTTGEAVDLNIAAMPGGDGINDVNRTPWLDDMLEKWGLHRPLTAFKGHKGRRERWHIAAMKGAGPIPEGGEPEPVETSSLSGKDKASIETDAKKATQEEAATPSVPVTPPPGASSVTIANIGADSNYGGGTTTGGSPVNTQAMSSVSSSTAAATAATAPAASASNTTMSVAREPAPVAKSIDYTEILSKQLEVQTQSMNYLKEISSKIASIASGSTPEEKTSDLGGQPGTTDFPAAAISLKRKTDYV